MGKVPFVIEMYKARDGWRWRMRSTRNRKIVAESGEAYTRPGNALRAIWRLPLEAECCSRPRKAKGAA